jgi:hypothetical protein
MQGDGSKPSPWMPPASPATASGPWWIRPPDGCSSAKRWPALLLAAAALDEASGDVVITLPDGAEHSAGRSEDRRRAVVVARAPVELRRAAGALPFEMYTDAADDDSATFEFAGPPDRWVDLAQAHC